jgi:uncharacterized DUF497 family protein
MRSAAMEDRSEAEGFEWDEGNESELARHHITPSEVEQVFDNNPAWAANRRGRSGDWVMYGPTNGGRALTIIMLVKEPKIRAVTGWDMSPGERTRYVRRRE